MQIKDGFLALAVAAMLGAPAVYAQQQDQSASSSGAMNSGSAASDQSSSSYDADRSARDEQSQGDSSSASAAGTMPDSDQQQSSAADSSESYGSQQSSLSQSDQQQDMSAGSGVAQTDVEPPVSSDTVRNIQQALKDDGQDIQVDGVWGENTSQALKEFQRDNDLDDSGQLDAETFAALEPDEHE